MKWKHKYADLMKSIADKFGFWCSGDEDGYCCDIVTEDNNKVATIRWMDDGEIYFLYACQALAYEIKKWGGSTNWPRIIERQTKFWETDDNCYIANDYLADKSIWRVLRNDALKDFNEQDLEAAILEMEKDFQLLITAEKRYKSDQKKKQIEQDFV